MGKDFRSFIAKGNLVQLAVAFILGGAFAAVVKSLVEDLIMPLVGKLVGNVDFSNLFLNLSATQYPNAAAAREAGAAAVYYGSFVNTVVAFLIVALVLFLIVRALMKLQQPEEPPLPAVKDCPFCLSSIPLHATRCPHCTSDLGSD